ncbi:CDP-alcohol phosphatidyltransferase family protein [Bryobacter aggregatus]|uniref:CDP-alcohol phosphatidyltransferase family protein n=1 Tax=Bryobacter aggregatus TaxID=360054 RepID=UPI00068A6F7B|nr:CDP-alcohol phosphatidyltransferase family protein [Bryobacter aggregatus]
MRWLPNALSLSRVFLAPLIGWMILNRHEWAWTLFFWISWTDALDGWLARKMGVASRLGAYLDPLGDKVWVIVATLAWWKMGRIPNWLMAMVLTRDFMILLGSAYVHRRTGQKDFSPSQWGKLSTIIQLTMLAGCFTLGDAWLSVLLYAAAVGTVISGVDYALTGRRMLRSGAAA